MTSTSRGWGKLKEEDGEVGEGDGDEVRGNSHLKSWVGDNVSYTEGVVSNERWQGEECVQL